MPLLDFRETEQLSKESEDIIMTIRISATQSKRVVQVES